MQGAKAKYPGACASGDRVTVPDHPDEELPRHEREAVLAILHGAVVTSSGVSVQRVLHILLELVLTRGLGAATYGIYAFGWRLMGMCLRFANLGANQTIMRDLQAFKGETANQRRSLGLGYMTTFVGSITFAILLFWAAEWINAVTIDEPAFPSVLRLFAALLVAVAVFRLHTVTLRAAKAATMEVLLNRIIYPTSRILAAIVAVGLGFSVQGVVGVFIVVIGLLAVLGFPFMIRITGLTPSTTNLRSGALHFYDHAIPSALSGVGKLLRTRIDVILIGIFLTATAAGVYNVVLVLVGLAGIPLMAFNQMMPPVASELYSDGRRKTLNAVYTTVTRLIVTATVPLIVFLAVFGEPLLSLFGEEFQRGYAVLLVFLVGRFIANAVGATGILLSMTNNHYPKLVLEWFLAVVNLVLTYVFVVEFGLIGAALGTSLAIGLQNALQLLVLRHYEALWPFDRTFLVPLGAGVGMGLVLWGTRELASGLPSLAFGGLIGLAVYVGLWWIAGPHRMELRLGQKLISRYRTRWSGVNPVAVVDRRVR